MTKVVFNYDIENMYNFLSENATEYFDNIVYDDTEKTITCYVGELPFVIFADHISGTTNYITVNTNGITTPVSVSTSNAYRWDIGYKCRGGIALSIAGAGDNTHYRWRTVITKDNAGKTVILLPETSNFASSAFATTIANGRYLDVDSDVSNGLSVTIMSTTTNLNVTGLCPAPITGSEGNYCENVFIALYRQYDYEGMIQIGDDKYLSNGGLLIKD